MVTGGGMIAQWLEQSLHFVMQHSLLVLFFKEELEEL